MLRFFLFGTPRFERDGELIVLSRRKAIALAAYLAVTRQAQSRDALATLFWPEHNQSAARANLRRDLSSVKQALGDDALVADVLQVGLNAQADVWLDVDHFRSLLEAVLQHHPDGALCIDCLGSLTEAVALYTGDFMEGFSLPDSARFDEWQFFRAESLRQLLAEALRQLGEWHAVQGEFERGIEYTRRWLALDPLHEPAHRQLMRLYAWSGQQSAALRQYQECVHVLEEQLGAPPAEETTALYETIRTRQLALPSESPTSSSEMALHERYVCEQLLTVGGHGEVYMGQDRVRGEQVVIKRLKPEITGGDSTLVARFTREGELLRQLKHPNIVTMLATFEKDGEHHIVMEYARGGSLREVLDQEKQLPIARALDIALELADALTRAHHLSVIHRDLKPENVLLAADGTPRLTDFGLARLQRTDMRLTQTGTVIGSPIYMGPEALRGEELDPRSDIWSFGVMIFEMLTGRYPFEGENIASMLASILESPLPDIRQFRANVPPALADLLQRMLTKDREQRIGSMRLVAAELEAIRAGRHDSDLLTPRPIQQTPVARRVATPHPMPSPLLRATRSASPAPADEQHIHFCRSFDDSRIAYATLGSGPLLIKSGNPLTHLEYDRNSPVWRHWWDALSRDHTLVRYDERGCGLSDWNVTDFSMQAWVHDLESVADQFGSQPFALLGVSQGASVALTYAVRHPERVSHLILYGGYVRGRFNRGGTTEEREEAETLIRLIRSGWGKDNPAFRQVFSTLLMPEGTPEQINWFNELARITASPENAATMERAFYEIDVRDLAAQVNVPTLILHARDDAMCPYEEGMLMASLIAGARFVPLESNNHILMESEPAWRQFVNEVRQFTQSGQYDPQPSRVRSFVSPSRPYVHGQNVEFCNSTDGTRIAYATIGQGPPLVKAANWLSHLEFDWVSPIWRHWLNGLSKRHTLIRYDERGCGLSDWDVADMSFEAWVSDLEAVVEAAGVDRFALLGISQGGPIAIAYAMRHPEKVSHLILYGTYARGKSLRDPTPEKLEEIDTLNKLIKLGWGQENPAFRQVFTSLFIPGGTPEQYRWFNELQRVSATSENAVRMMSGFNAIDVRDIAPKIQTPTLILHARGDARIPFEEGEQLKSLMPHARFVPLDSKNHILLESEPAWSQFLAEVHAFLEMEGSTSESTLSLSRTHLRSSHHSLPMPATSFVGREQELIELRHMFMDDPANRLLTLVGPGGVGKTRLAIALAEMAQDAFGDNVSFISFVQVNSPDLIIYTIAEALGMVLAGSSEPKDQLIRFLHDKTMLLVLDNLEHLLAGVDVIGDILEAAPHIKILATSRERLNLHAEHPFDLRGLAVPKPDSSDIQHYDAIRLFIQSASRSRREFALHAGNLEAVVRVCQLVEGVPLAIELAASWLRTLSPAEIAREIEKGIDILQTSIRDLPERHRSMRAVFDYSWNLLSEQERTALRRLSVFDGGFRREAAEEVVDATLAVLSSLADKSLLNIDSSRRYSRHPLLLQYASEKLAELPEERVTMHEKHAAYFIRFLHEWGKELRGGRQKEALEVIALEIENIHAVWRWAIAEKRFDVLRSSWDSIDEFYIQRNRVCEGAEVFAQFARGLDESNADHRAMLGRVLLSEANLNFRLDRFARVFDLAEQGLKLLRLANDKRDLMKGLNLIGISAMRVGEFERAKSHIEEAIAIAREQGDRGRIANFLNNLGLLEYEAMHYAQAAQAIQEAMEINHDLGNYLSITRNLSNLGDVYLGMRELEVAESYLREGLTMAREMGFAQIAPYLLSSLGAVIRDRGDYTTGREILEEALHLARAHDVQTLQSETLRHLGGLAAIQGDAIQAQNWYAQSLEISSRIPGFPYMLGALVNLAELWMGQDRARDAAEIFYMTVHHKAAWQHSRDKAEKMLLELQHRLSSEELAEAKKRGETLDLAEAVDSVLKSLAVTRIS